MQSTADWLAVLMDNYKVLLYNGQLDLIVGGPLTERFLQVLKWSGQEDYLKVDRTVWRIGDEVAGYVRQVGKFMQVRICEFVPYVIILSNAWHCDCDYKFLSLLAGDSSWCWSHSPLRSARERSKPHTNFHQYG